MDRPTLDNVSLITANFGHGRVFRDVLGDWTEFLGGRPEEVVVVDGGSDAETQAQYLEAYRDGDIDKLQLIRPEHPDNSKERCVVQEHACAMIARHDVLVWMKVDTLPFRRGHEGWFDEARALLDEPDVFAVSGSFNRDRRTGEYRPGWYTAEHVSINFAVMKRDRFIAALEEYAGAYVSSGFTSDNPGREHGTDRFVIESAFRAYVLKHGLKVLAKYESEDWSVFHTNVPGDRLPEVRERYRRREGVAKMVNARNFTTRFGGCYYGQPGGGRWHAWKCRFGRQRVAAWLRERLGLAPVGPTSVLGK